MAGFDWISFMAKFRKALLSFEHRRETLYDVMQRTDEKLRHQYPNEKFKSFMSSGAFAELTAAEHPKADIDPFSVLLFIMKFYSKRHAVMQCFLDTADINLSCPNDFNSIHDIENGIIEETSSSAVLQQGQYQCENIDNLWALLRQIDQGQIDEVVFNKVLNIKGNGIRTLSRALYYLMPDYLFPYCAQTVAWIEKLGLPAPEESWQSYHAFLQALHQKIDGRPLYECVREALMLYQASKVSITTTTTSQQLNKSLNMPLNQILYGPPGTGKTYQTKERAVQIVDTKWQTQQSDESSTAYQQRLHIRYKMLVAAGRIQFTTFHQSYSYEDFVEGIRPVLDDGTAGLNYRIEDGIFKKIALKADRAVADNNVLGLSESPRLWKISIGEVYKKEMRDRIIANGEARIGWNEVGNAISSDSDSTVDEHAYWKNLGPNDQRSINYFCNDVSIGDVFLCFKSQDTIQAVGIVTSDYEYDLGKNTEEYRRVRKVNWLLQDIDFDIRKLNGGKGLTLPTIYELKRFTWDDLCKALDESGYPLPIQANSTAEKPNYVLVIDEINRGNVAQIFGELITLLEADKRKGAANTIEATLPYSQDSFQVPDNLYLIGTMNTADKSLTQLDFALRRRFHFIQIAPDASLLEGTKVYDVDLGEMLNCINQRIAVLLDEDHTIGHSYFMPLCGCEDNAQSQQQLADIFAQNILPLLSEYFYDDHQRIGMVLGDFNKHNSTDKFVTAQNINSHLLPEGETDKVHWKINFKALKRPMAYQGIITRD